MRRGGIRIVVRLGQGAHGGWSHMGCARHGVRRHIAAVIAIHMGVWGEVLASGAEGASVMRV